MATREEVMEDLLGRALQYLHNTFDHYRKIEKPTLKQTLSHQKVEMLINNIKQLSVFEVDSDLPYYGNMDHAKKVHFGEYPKRIFGLEHSFDEILEEIKSPDENTIARIKEISEECLKRRMFEKKEGRVWNM